MTMTNEWNAVRNLLCVQLGSPGDVLMCTPALRALRAQCPGRRVTLLAAPAGATLGPYLPDADTVLAHEAPWTQNGPAASHLDWIAGLAAQGFEGAVIFTGYRESSLPAALLCQLAGIPLRAGWCRETPHQLLTHWIADPEPGAMVRHPVQRQLDLARHLGAEIADKRMAFVPASQDLTAVCTRLQAAGIDPAGRWLVLHPGAGVQARRYPRHHWRTLVQALAERIGCPLVLIGAAHEQALIDAIQVAPAAHVHSLVGQLGIGELGALLSQASLLVSSNPGTAQLAAAVGTPLVDLGGPADAGQAPWRVPSRVPSHDAGGGGGLEKPAPAQVVDAVCSLLKQTEAYRAQDRPMNRHSDECPPRA
jgi:ADP-heptose:LPS heptosyltransferase